MIRIVKQTISKHKQKIKRPVFMISTEKKKIQPKSQNNRVKKEREKKQTTKLEAEMRTGELHFAVNFPGELSSSLVLLTFTHCHLLFFLT